MALTTLNNAGGNIELVSGGEINASGQVQNGYYSFDNATVYANDFTETTPSGSADITTNSGKLTILLDGTADTYGFPAVNRVTQNASLTGIFDFHFTMDTNFTSTSQVSGVYFNTDADNFVRLMVFDSGLVQFRRAVGGVATDTYSVNISTDEAAAEIKLRMARDVSNNITAYYWRVGVDAGWQQVGGSTITDSGSRSLAFSAMSKNTIFSTTFDDLTFTSGSSVDAEFKIIDSGNDYIDAGEFKVIDKGTVSNESTGTLSVKEYVSDTPTFTDYGSLLEWATTYPHVLTDRYWWLYFVLAGDSATFTSLSYDVASSDLVNPTSPTDAIALYDPDSTTIDAFMKFTNGYDNAGGIGYAGTNIGYYDSNLGVWKYEQENGTFEETETFADLKIEGQAETESLAVLQDLTNAATKIRLTGYDLAGNNSARTDINLIQMGSGETVEPTIPDVSYVDNADDTGAVVSISNGTDTATNTVCYKLLDADTWTTGNAITGNGETTIDTTNGTYFVYVSVYDSLNTAVSDISIVSITDGTETPLVLTLNAVKSELDIANLLDYSGSSIASSVDYTPFTDLDNYSNPLIVIYPQADQPTAYGSGVDNVQYTIVVQLIAKAETDAEIKFYAKLKRTIQKTLINNRLQSYTNAVATETIESSSLATEELRDRYFVSYIPINYNVTESY